MPTFVARHRCGCVVAAWFGGEHPMRDSAGCANVVGWLLGGLKVSVTTDEVRIGAYRCWRHGGFGYWRRRLSRRKETAK